MYAAVVVRMNGHVASGALRWNVTVASSGVEIEAGFHLQPSAPGLLIALSRLQAPFGSLISRFRLNEKATSSDVSAEPSLNFSPGLSVHV